jgi:hypothetical protein
MPTTYEPIATTTLSSAAASITFSSIPATYTDLRMIINTTGSTGGPGAYLRPNNDGSALYSFATMIGDGSAVSTFKYANFTDGFWLSFNAVPSARPTLYTADIFSYAGSTNKTCLSTASTDNNGSGFVERTVSMYRSTSAITQLSFTSLGSATYASGTTATLYGIKNA